MMGRVMGCIEQVVIHDGHGRPLYLRTFSGHADLRENALRTMDELDIVLNKKRESRAKESPGSRALIIDGAGNAVQTLRAFSESDYHYITILDTNQIVDRKFKHLKAPQRYQYGEAFLIDCRIELMDSKGYESRAVRVQWDNGKECCLVTRSPQTSFMLQKWSRLILRWPYCEKQLPSDLF